MSNAGRNDPCPCGSGKKYKRCHGALAAAVAASDAGAAALFNHASNALQRRDTGGGPSVSQQVQTMLPPWDAAAWHLAGTIDLQRGDHEAASLKLLKAIQLDPARAQFHRTLARARFGRGEFAEAAASARRAITLDAGSADAWVALGLSLEATEPDAALAAWEKAVALAPGEPEAQFRIGNLQRRRGNHVGAVAAYRAAQANGLDHPVLLNNLALALQEQGQFAEAELSYRRAIEQQPNLLEAHANLADLLYRRHRFAEALTSYGQAIAVNPGISTLWLSLGVCQYRIAMLSAAEASLKRAIELDMSQPNYFVSMAAVLLAQQREADALPFIRRALELQPDLAEARNMLLYASQQTCDWVNLGPLFEQQRAGIHDPDVPAVMPHNLLGLPYEPAELLTAARKWVTQRIRPKPTQKPPWPGLVAGRLRIGYLGSDFRTHALANLLTEVIERHDRRRFEVYGYSFGPDDKSAARTRFIAAFDRFIDVRSETFEQTAQRVRDDRIAVLFDTGGYVLSARSEIFALRPAPLQINCIGFPGTLGADYYDYILTDGFVTPPSQQGNFAEQFMLLPHCYLPSDTQRQIGEIPTRAHCQLPPTGFVFCCFNACWKIHPMIFDVWMRLLRGIPSSVLWLLDTNAASRDNLCREASRRSIAPERLIFAKPLPLAEHLARHAVADLFLDTFPCNAHTTSNDALFAGLPVLTCAGKTFASRVSGSQLHAIGLPELVTYDLADYEALALKLANEPTSLEGYRARLRANRGREPLFNPTSYATAFEGLLLAAAEGLR